jgi:competence protein ComEA
MNWKAWIEDYFYFSRKDRIGLYILLFLIAATFLLPHLLSRPPKQFITGMDSAWMATNLHTEPSHRDTAEDFPGTEYRKYYKETPDEPDKMRGELFYFDPNRLTPAEGKRLGLRDRTMQTLQNYLRKGGRFQQPADLKKIYGLHEDEYERLAPYVRFDPLETPALKKESRPPPVEKRSRTITSFDINSSDSIEWIALPGIGERLASRIIHFREHLGGFYAIDQVAETYGLPDSTFQKIKPYLLLQHADIRRLDINRASVEELKAHPYIKWNIANAIVQYRSQHGNFAKPEEIKNIALVDEALYQKLSPYIEIK